MPYSSGVVRGNFELLTGSSYVYAIAEFIVASIAIITRTETTNFFTRIPPLIHFSCFVHFLLRQTGYSGLPCELLPSFKIIIFKHYFYVKYFFSYRIHIRLCIQPPNSFPSFLTIFVYHLISKIVFHLLIVNEKIRNFEKIPITGER